MLGLSVSFWLAFGGFLVVLAVAVALEREVRLLARERLGTLPISAWLGGGRRQARPTIRVRLAASCRSPTEFAAAAAQRRSPTWQGAGYVQTVK